MFDETILCGVVLSDKSNQCASVRDWHGKSAETSSGYIPSAVWLVIRDSELKNVEGRG